jgi:hypothetical protein
LPQLTSPPVLLNCSSLMALPADSYVVQSRHSPSTTRLPCSLAGQAFAVHFSYSPAPSPFPALPFLPHERGATCRTSKVIAMPALSIICPHLPSTRGPCTHLPASQMPFILHDWQSTRLADRPFPARPFLPQEGSDLYSQSYAVTRPPLVCHPLTCRPVVCRSLLLHDWRPFRTIPFLPHDGI